MGAFGKMPIVSSVAGMAAKTPAAKITGMDERLRNVQRNAKKPRGAYGHGPEAAQSLE